MVVKTGAVANSVPPSPGAIVAAGGRMGERVHGSTAESGQKCSQSFRALDYMSTMHTHQSRPLTMLRCRVFPRPEDLTSQ
jgi:hypothetical protein